MRKERLYLILWGLPAAWSFTGISSAIKAHPRGVLSAVQIDGYDGAFKIIDECAITGEPGQELYNAVRYIEKNGYKIYPDMKHKQELWDNAHGSWKLQLSTGGSKNRSFHKPPKFLPFSFAMIDDEHFGNGIGKNENTIWLSLLHKHFFQAKYRRMVVTVEGVYLFGHPINKFLPDFVRRNLGKQPVDYTEKPPPTFVIVGCSKHALIARGNQSGGLAIWTRLPQDIRQIAYQDDGNSRPRIDSHHHTTPGLI